MTSRNARPPHHWLRNRQQDKKCGKSFGFLHQWLFGFLGKYAASAFSSFFDRVLSAFSNERKAFVQISMSVYFRFVSEIICIGWRNVAWIMLFDFILMSIFILFVVIL